MDFIKSYQEKFGKEPVQNTCCGTKPFESIEDCQKMIESIDEINNNCFKELSTEKKTKFAFVIFISKIQTRQIFEEWNDSSIFHHLSCCRKPQYDFKGNYVYAELAPEPTDVNWENLSVSTRSRYIRRFFTFFVAAAVLFITFIVVYFTHR